MDDPKSLTALVAATWLHDALDAIERDGRFWPGAITRPCASRLCDLVAAEGHRVLLHELPPEWEHVLALSDTPVYKLKAIARRRHVLRESGTAEAQLPR